MHSTWALRAALAGVATWGVLASHTWAQEWTGAAPDATVTVSKETMAITQPLRADGTVDYVAAINAKYGQGITPENNAFVTWLTISGTERGFFAYKTEDAVLKLCGARPTPLGMPTFENISEYLERTKPGINLAALEAGDQELTDAEKSPWKPEAHPDIVAYLKEEEPFLTLAQDAAKQPKWWAPSVAEDGRSLLSVTLYSVGSVREVTKVVCAQAMLNAGIGKIDTSLAQITAVRKLARLLGSASTEIERLVGIAIERQAVEAFAVIAASGLLTESQCAAAASDFDRMPPMPALAETLDIQERWIALDTVVGVIIGRWQAIAAADPKAGRDSIGIMFRTVDRSAVDWDVVLKQVNHFYDDQLAIFRLTSCEEIIARSTACQKQLDAWDQEAQPIKHLYDFTRIANETPQAYTDRIGRAMISLLSSNFAQGRELEERTLLEAQMARATIAAAQFRAHYGRWPEQLKELVPGMLATVPQDFYSKKGADVIKYKLTPAGPRIYCVGRNGIDDGGKHDPAKQMDDIAVGAP